MEKDSIHIHHTNHDFRTDRRLSYKARGILAYIFSHPHNWQLHVETLVNESDEDGRIAVQSGMQELLRWGYATLETLRDHGKVQGKRYHIHNVPVNMQPDRQAGNIVVGTDKQETRQSENLSIGTDKQVLRQTQNMPVGRKETDVDTSPHRRAGFPSDGFPDSQETCLIKNQDLRERETQEERPPVSTNVETSPKGATRTTREKRAKRYMPKEEKAQQAMANSILDAKFEIWRAAQYPEADGPAQWAYFVNYCLASGRQYADFRAAFMNSFSWENSPAQHSMGSTNNVRNVSRAPSFAEQRRQREAEAIRQFVTGGPDGRPTRPPTIRDSHEPIIDDIEYRRVDP